MVLRHGWTGQCGRIVRHALQMGEQSGGLDVLCLQEIAVNYPDLQAGPATSRPS
jgi:hypothetical protein